MRDQYYTAHVKPLMSESIVIRPSVTNASRLRLKRLPDSISDQVDVFSARRAHRNLDKIL